MITSFFCAGQVSPSGGPADKTSPQIIGTYPDPAAIHFNDRKIAFRFSKYVDRRSFEESVFISPALGELTFDWSSTEVEISFSDSLRRNITYVMTVGTDVVDTRGNRMAKAFALPFSTGEKIDTGAIAGKIFDPKPEGIMVFAYRLNSMMADTLDPTHVKPDYLTQTGKDGSFVLPYLSLGLFRVVAVRDEFKNLVYDRQIDQYGVWISDIMLTDSFPAVSGVQFKMTNEDTTPPFLSSARALDQSHVLLRFSERMDTAIVAGQSISIIDTITNSRLPVYDISYSNAGANEMQIVTAQQESSRTYAVRLNGFKDVHQNLMKSNAYVGFFAGSALADTVKPILQSTNVVDSMKNVQVNDTVRFYFNEAIMRSSFEGGFDMFDSSGRKVTGTFLWFGSCAISFVPAHEFLWNHWYTITVSPDSVKDFLGNHLADSVWMRNIRTIDERLMGSLKGTALDAKEGEGKIYLTVTEVSNKNTKSQFQTLNSPGEFSFNRLMEGKYSIFAFRDSDNNRTYTYGGVFPFRESERFSGFTDTLKVRARWPLEGLVIHFK